LDSVDYVVNLQQIKANIKPSTILKIEGNNIQFLRS